MSRAHLLGPPAGAADPPATRRPGRRALAARLGRAARLARLAGRVLLGVLALGLGLSVAGTLSGRWGLVPVLTGSMRPGIQPGDVVLVSPEALSAVRPGQVIDFQPPGEGGASVVHRVVSVTRGPAGTVIRTKGDANDVADPWKARLGGKSAWRVRAVIPKLGYLAVAEHQPYVRLSVEAALALGGLGLGLSAIWGRRSKERGDGPLAEGLASS